MEINIINSLLSFTHWAVIVIGLIWFFSNFLAIGIVGPYFHKKFKHYDNPLFETSLIYPGFIVRGIWYCIFILFKQLWPRSPLKPIYGDLNFREHARTIDIIISCWFMGSFLMGTIVVIMDVVLKFFM